jgi:hypothetical protein
MDCSIRERSVVDVDPQLELRHVEGNSLFVCQL